MGNRITYSSDAATYIASETFHPSEIAFNNFPLVKDRHYDENRHLLRIENPLRIKINDKLKLVGSGKMFVGSDGTSLYKMRNMTTGEVGLVIDDCFEITKTTQIAETTEDADLDNKV